MLRKRDEVLDLDLQIIVAGEEVEGSRTFKGQTTPTVCTWTQHSRNRLRLQVNARKCSEQHCTTQIQRRKRTRRHNSDTHKPCAASPRGPGPRRLRQRTDRQIPKPCNAFSSNLPPNVA